MVERDRVTGAAPDRVIRSRRVVTPDCVREAAIHIRGGVITAIRPWADVPAGCALEDVGRAVVMPGIVDAHVHVNDPGRAEWEGFHTATRAAAAGGVTTIVDMPLNAVPATTSVPALHAKLSAAEGACHVDVGFWGGIVPGNESGATALWDAGVLGFKCFLSPSGVAEFGHVGEGDLRQAMPLLAEMGAVLLAHAEDPDFLRPGARGADPRSYATYLATRPPAAEQRAIDMLIRLSASSGARVHVVHLAAAEAVPALARARALGVPITVETAPHYLHFAAEDIGDGRTGHKCAPPIRDRGNRERLWEALMAGTIDLIASDHSPCPPDMKAPGTGDFLRAWGGIASLQLVLPVMWENTQRRGYTVRDLARWMCAAPAKLAGLGHRKGAIAVGMDADFVVWNPDAEMVVNASMLEHRHKPTPYAGARLHGPVQATWVRGVKVYDRGRFPAPGHGQALLRGDARRALVGVDARVDVGAGVDAAARVNAGPGVDAGSGADAGARMDAGAHAGTDAGRLVEA